MALTFLSRKPDSGLGNIRSSPGAPSRNVDFVLLFTQGLLTIIGCAVVYSASRTRLADPYAFVTRQVVFAIVASVLMVFVMMVDYEWFKERAAFLYGLTMVLLVLLLLMGIAQNLDRISFDLGPFNFQPAEMAKFTTLHRAVRLPVRGAQRRGELRPLRRRADHGRRPGGADHPAARPRVGLGDHHDRDGCAAGGGREAEVHRPDLVPARSAPSPPRSSVGS